MGSMFGGIPRFLQHSLRILRVFPWARINDLLDDLFQAYDSRPASEATSVFSSIEWPKAQNRGNASQQGSSHQCFPCADRRDLTHGGLRQCGAT